MSVSNNSEEYQQKPYVDGSVIMYGGNVNKWKGETANVCSYIFEKESGNPIVIGNIAQMDENTAMQILDNAKWAWDKGTGEWPQMHPMERIAAIEKLVRLLKIQREKIIHVLTWDICKSIKDATSEFDRTMDFIDASIASLKCMLQEEDEIKRVGSTIGLFRRTAIGIMLALGPSNYPFNETYTSMIPALLMGNIVIMKIPSEGGLAHVLTMNAFADALPPGVVNFLSGPGTRTVGPIMESGAIDVLSLVGSTEAADTIIKQHSQPHRLKLSLSLEGKNVAIVFEDADLELAAQECVKGGLSFNGQRCTALKLIFAHESVADTFVQTISNKVEALQIGFPWSAGVNITPIDQGTLQYQQELIRDASQYGASVVNNDGGRICDGSIMIPAVVFPVTDSMRIWKEEQFGPIIAIARYSDIEDVYQYVMDSMSGLQASIFTSSAENAVPAVAVLAQAVGRINLNTQCGRSPDSFPFSGRRSSGLGTLSSSEALKNFSIQTVLATNCAAENEKLITDVVTNSDTFAPLK